MLLALAGCSTFEKINPFGGKDNTSDYKLARLHPPLDVPPDLTVPQSNDLYSVPRSGSGTTFSQYSQQQQLAQQAVLPHQTTPTAINSVLPGSDKAILERDGNTRWLRVKLPAQQVWPVVESFWKRQGYSLPISDPITGVMRTDWHPIQVKSPSGMAESASGSFFGGDLGGEMSMYTTRLERGSEPETTEIYISYHGAIEKDGNNSDWRSLPPDPQKELDKLMKLLVSFGVRSSTANAELAHAADFIQPRAIVINNGTALIIKEDFKNAWRRIGLALDREDFMVQNRNRTAGIYYVKYKQELPGHAKQSWLAKIEFWKTAKPAMVTGDYQIKVTGDAQNSLIQVQDIYGYPLKNEVAQKIVSKLNGDLK